MPRLPPLRSRRLLQYWCAPPDHTRRSAHRVAACALAALTVGFFVSPAAASPLQLKYSVCPRPDGRYDYTFTLRLTNADDTWVFGHTYNWIVFGDADRAESPLADFVGQEPSPVPWHDDGFNFSSGTHNGPCLIDSGRNQIFPGWAPLQIGAEITWRGHASRELANGQLVWSSLLGTGVRVYLEPAVQVFTCDGLQPCAVADFNVDGGVDGADVTDFFITWSASHQGGDVNNDGGVDGADLEFFFTYWAAGGC